VSGVRTVHEVNRLSFAWARLALYFVHRIEHTATLR
jgi:hypothetical protein